MFRTVSSSIKFSFVLTIVFSLLLAGGCKSAWQEQTDSTPQTETAPIQPAPPVLADGSRASYADIVERVSPAVVNINVEQKSKPNQSPQSQLPFGDFFRNLPDSPQGN